MKDYGIESTGKNMIFYKNLSAIDLSEKIKHYLKFLKYNDICILNTSDHIEILSAFAAWLESDTGSIAFLNPLLPEKQINYLKKQIHQQTIKSSIVFHTSGTTGMPKLVIRGKDFMQDQAYNAKYHAELDEKTFFANVVPGSTGGFMHIIASSWYFNNMNILLSSKEDLSKDLLNPEINSTLIVPGLCDWYKKNNIELPLTNLKSINTGSSAFYKSHAEFLFDNGAYKINHIYGSTEIGAPVLSKSSNCINEQINYLEINDRCKFTENNELIYNGMHTGDIFIKRDNNQIEFVGRNNDIVKLNGYFGNLLQIEKEIEELYPNTETLAIKRTANGSDYIELMYSGSLQIKRNDLKLLLQDKLPKCNIPLKCSKVDEIPKNPSNKKVRHLSV